MSQNKSYRIRTNINEDKVVNVNLNRDFDFLEMLSVKISQESVYNVKSSNYGVVIGRIMANDGFGVPNAKVSIFIQKSEDDRDDVSFIYPYNSVLSKDKNNIRYNLLPNTNIDDCHKGVGTFPSKRELLDNDSQIEVYERYWKYTTVTNNSGDYMLFGVPTGSYILHVDIDLSDIGVLSQKPSDFFFKGYNRELFESAKQFKTSTNLDSITQIVSENKTVQVFPFWGDPDSGDNISITRCDVNINYKFEPTCVFLGSIITDSDDNSISNTCVANRNSGDNGNMVTKSGTIEMIRKTPTGTVEEFRILGNELINGDGVWCYQIPMNLDYITTDEFGDIVPSNDVTKGIPTRTSVRFRVSLDNGDVNDNSNYRFKYLIPNYNDDGKYTYDRMENYRFGSGTLDEHFRDLYWDDVYTVKSYIPRVQKIGDDKNVVGNNCNKNSISIKYTNFHGVNNPIPYNKINICKKWWVGIFCALLHLVLGIINLWNDFMDNLEEILKIFNVNLESWKIQINITDDDTGKNVIYKPSNSNNHGKVIEDKIDKYILDEYKIIDLGFYNDWLNGSLYLPVMNFSKNSNGEWQFCNCENKDIKDVKIYDNCIYNTDLALKNKYINEIAQTNVSSIDNSIYGIGKVVTNMDGLDIYYYSTQYKTDIVLLGNIKNNMSLLNKLQSTTHVIPSIFNTYKTETDANGNAVGNVLMTTETTPMDWNENDKDYQGLFFNFKCLDLSTKFKSCVNVKRICELGVGQDVKQDGLILKDEIVDNDGRLMFTMLNGNGLLSKRKDNKTNYYINQFKNVYHNGFDGIIGDDKNDDYISFVKNNSFYFYFGLHYGKTAIDEFKRLYNQTCKPLGELKMDYTIDYSDSSACNNTGAIKISNVGKEPYDVIINGNESQGLYGMNGDTMISGLDNVEYVIDIIDSDDNKSTEVIELNKNKFGFTISNTFFNEEVKKEENDGTIQWDRNALNFVTININNINYCGGYVSIKKIESYKYDINTNEFELIIKGVVTNQITSFDIDFKIHVKKEDNQFGNFFDLNGYGRVPFDFKDNNIIFGISTPGVYEIKIGELCTKVVDEEEIKVFDEDTISILNINVPNKANIDFMINNVNSEHLFTIENDTVKTIDSRFTQFISLYNNSDNIIDWYKNDNFKDKYKDKYTELDGKLTINNTTSNISSIDDLVNDICGLMINNTINTLNNLNYDKIDYSAKINNENINGNDIYLVYDRNQTTLNANEQSEIYGPTEISIINSVNINNGIITTSEPLIKLNIERNSSIDSYGNIYNGVKYNNINNHIYSAFISNENGTKIPNNIVEYDGTNNSLNNYIKLQTVDRGIYGDLTFIYHNKYFKNGNKSNIVYGNVYGGLPLNFDDNGILSKFSDIKDIQKDDDTFIIENYHEENIEITSPNDNDILPDIEKIFWTGYFNYAKVMSMLIRLFKFNNIEYIIGAFETDSILYKMNLLSESNIFNPDKNKINNFISNYIFNKKNCNYLDLRLYNFFDVKYIGDDTNAIKFLFDVLDELYSNENFKSFINFNHEYAYYFTSSIKTNDNNIIVENFTCNFPNNTKPNVLNKNDIRKLPCNISNVINNNVTNITNINESNIDMYDGYGIINVDNICYENDLGVFKMTNKKVFVNKPNQDIPFYHLSGDTNTNDIIFNTNDKNVEKKISSYHVNYGKTIDKNELYLTNINMSFYRQNFNDSNFNNVVYYSNGELKDKTYSFFENNDGKLTHITYYFTKFKYEDDVLCFYIKDNNNIDGWYCFNKKDDKTCTLSPYIKLVLKQAQLSSSIEVSLKFYEDLVKEISTMLINKGEYFGNGDISISTKNMDEDNTLYFTTKEEINLDGNCFDVYTTFYNKINKPLEYTLNTTKSSVFSDEVYVDYVEISDDLFDNVINDVNENNINAWFSNNINTRQYQCVISYSNGTRRFELSENDKTKLSINDNVYLYITVGDDNMESYHLTINEPLPSITFPDNNLTNNGVTILPLN